MQRAAHDSCPYFLLSSGGAGTGGGRERGSGADAAPAQRRREWTAWAREKVRSEGRRRRRTPTQTDRARRRRAVAQSGSGGGGGPLDPRRWVVVRRVYWARRAAVPTHEAGAGERVRAGASPRPWGSSGPRGGARVRTCAWLRGRSASVRRWERRTPRVPGVGSDLRPCGRVGWGRRSDSVRGEVWVSDRRADEGLKHAKGKGW